MKVIYIVMIASLMVGLKATYAIDAGSFDPSDTEVSYLNLPTILRAESRVERRVGSKDRISTHLVMSINGGQTFSHAGIVNPVVPINEDMFWQSEVPSIFKMGTKTQKVGLVWHKYLQYKQYNLYNMGWIGLRTKNSVYSTFGREVKLIAGNDYDPQNSVYPEPRHPLFELPEQMRDCKALTEPGALQTPQGFLMAVNCYDGQEMRISLLHFSLKSNDELEMQFLGHLFERQETRLVEEFYSRFYPEITGFDRLSAPDIFISQGKAYLLVTPSSDSQGYLGCFLFQFKDLAKGELVKSAHGMPIAIKYIQGQIGTHRGACTYSQMAERSGIVLSQLLIPSLYFTIQNTGVTVP